MGTALRVSESVMDIAYKAKGYGVPGQAVDGMDVLSVESATRAAAQRVRSGGGPELLEMRTYRFRGHSLADPELYRTKDEVLTWQKLDPIATFEAYLMQAGLLTNALLASMEEGVGREVADSEAFAEASPWESLEDLTGDVYSR
jgi:TPP-dependent pyruvate/acetoin dehydrogenase alpha subunit